MNTPKKDNIQIAVRTTLVLNLFAGAISNPTRIKVIAITNGYKVYSISLIFTPEIISPSARVKYNTQCSGKVARKPVTKAPGNTATHRSQ